MNLGKLHKPNQEFLDRHKDFGFSTSTAMVNASLEELRRKLSREKRAAWRTEALDEYLQTNPKNAFEGIESDPIK